MSGEGARNKHEQSRNIGMLLLSSTRERERAFALDFV